MQQLSIECSAVDPLSAEFAEKCRFVSECLSRAYTPVETAFAGQFPEALQEDKFLHSIASFFKGGLDRVDWSEVEKGIFDLLYSFFSEKLPVMSAADPEKASRFAHSFIIARDQEAKVPVGALYCLTSRSDPGNIVNIPIFGVAPEAQSQGTGRRLMGSVVHYIPNVKKIALSTRVTNEKAIRAYRSWGFVPVADTMNYWMNLEYAVVDGVSGPISPCVKADSCVEGR